MSRGLAALAQQLHAVDAVIGIDQRLRRDARRCRRRYAARARRRRRISSPPRCRTGRWQLSRAMIDQVIQNPLPSGRVALHAARIGGGAPAAADFRGGGEAALRPVGAGLHDMAALASGHRRSPSARGSRPPARRAARCAARTRSGNARNARPARRSLPAGSAWHGRAAGRIAWSIDPADRRRASPRRDTARRRAAPWSAMSVVRGRLPGASAAG